jgi:hypothetical protein
MRLLIFPLILVAVALLSGTQASHAQGAGSYPWCAKDMFRDSSGSWSCYYRSRQECRNTQSGLGGLCIENPYYHPQPTPQAKPSAEKRHHPPHPPHS